MKRTVILGADPGVCTGYFLLTPAGGLAYQCSHNAAYGLATFLIESNDGPATIVCAGEAFVSGRGAGARQAGAAVTRALIADLGDLTAWHWRPAVTVKAWSTDKRLEAAGLLTACRGMPHAADAARHSLYASVYNCGWPDPLSKDGPAFWKAMTA